MDGQFGSAEASLKKSWRRWTAIVAAFARVRRSRQVITKREYREVHRAILDACNALAATADTPQRRLLLDLLELAHPWVSLESLARADREVVVKLLVNCQEAQRQLEGRSRIAESLRAAMPLFVLAFLLVGIAAWLFPTLHTKGTWRLLDTVEGFFYLAHYALMQTTFAERLFATAAVVTLATVYLVWRSARRY